MEGQRINVEVLGRRFKMTAVSEQMEQNVRLAAEEISRAVNELKLEFQGEDVEDLLAIVAVRQCVGKLLAQQKASEIEEELTSLNDSLNSYLKGQRI